MSQKSPKADGGPQPVYTPSPNKGLKLSKLSSNSSKSTRTVTRSGSVRSKGFSVNLAVSPASSVVTPPQTSTTAAPNNVRSSQTSDVSPVGANAVQDSIASDYGHDVPLPPLDELHKLDIDTQLRLLAFKEMNVVEIKDNISKLNNLLDKSEGEVHKLREIIQRSLYKELRGSANASHGHQRQYSNPRDEAIASTKNRTRRRTLSSSNPNALKNTPVPEPEPVPSTSSNTQNNRRNSNLWTNLSKPLNFIQQFDTMLQNEFEKSLIPSSVTDTTNSVRNSSPTASHKSTLSEESVSSFNSIPSPLKSKSKDMSKLKENARNWDIDIGEEIKSNNTHGGSDHQSRNTEDMLHSVSSSIWSFVNDVKQNVLSSLDETPTKVNDSASDAYDTTLTNQSKGSKPSIDLSDSKADLLFQDVATCSRDNQDQSNLDQTLDTSSINDPTNDANTNESDDEKIDLSIYSSMRRR